MSFSPRPRPHTVGLSFTDHDLTDTYRDETATATSSSPQRRHPRGDTPLSRRQLSVDDYSSPGRWTVSSRRSVSERDGGGGLDDEEGERSNLDKLLDLLDDDDQDGGAEMPPRSPGVNRNRTFATSTPPPPPPGSRSPYPPSTARRTLPSSSRPAHASPSTTAADPTATYASESPSLRARQRSFSSLSASALHHHQQQRPTSALSRFQRSNGGVDGGRAGAPDSPSPRPGSVAALRGKSEGSFVTAGERSGLSGRVGVQRVEAGQEAAAGKGKGKEREYRDGKEEEGEGEETDTEGGSLDSVARVAQAAMDEFDTIISHGVSSSSRSASRLRNIPSPARTPPTPPATSAYSAALPAQPAQPAQYRAASAQAGNDEINAHLVQELRDAQDYIAYLQDELRSISDVVVQLRERPEQASPRAAATAHPNGFASSETPSPVSQRTRVDLRSDDGGRSRMRAEEEQVVLEETTQAAFEVVKHLTALLPSLSLSPSPTSPSHSSSSPPHAPSLTSLALALSFTRQMDQLAHNLPPHMGQRRDEEVFTRENLERVGRRVRGWERVARGGRGEEEEEG